MKKTNAEVIAVMKTDIEYIKRDMTHIKDKLDNFITSADNRYAEKEIERKVNKNFETIESIKLKMAYYAGGIAVVLAVVEIALRMI